MKKILAVLATITLTMTACADHNHLIEYSELPVQAQAFIQKYFNISHSTLRKRKILLKIWKKEEKKEKTALQKCSEVKSAEFLPLSD